MRCGGRLFRRELQKLSKIIHPGAYNFFVDVLRSERAFMIYLRAYFQPINNKLFKKFNKICFFSSFQGRISNENWTDRSTNSG